MMYKKCTFFGHRDAPDTLRPLLREVLAELIEKQNVTRFYLGQQGNFDAMALGVLAELRQTHDICYEVVLAYLPAKQAPLYETIPTVLPEGIEKAPRRFAIDYRNRWMVAQSDIVITYVTRAFGGAAKFKEAALKKRKTVIELSGRNV